MAELSCPGCRQRDTLIAALQQRIEALGGTVDELQARLGQNASNSSLPPSANPVGAPKPVVKKPSGRKPGGQPGHPACVRVRLPRERVNHLIRLIPPCCERCAAALPYEAGPHDPEPTWHQVAELPELTAHITEFQGHARTCPECGHVTREVIPEEIRRHVVGPRLAAVMSYVSGARHDSKRGVEEISETVFGVRLALGTVSALEEQTSQALAPAQGEAQEAVQQAAVKNVDETSWKLAGKLCWLWLAATAHVACFLIHPRRSAAGLKALLGEVIHGIVGTDRWSAYRGLSSRMRQICWAHLKRDFQKCVDRGGDAALVGELGLSIVAGVFKAWHTFRGGGSTNRAQLHQQLEPLALALGAGLEHGGACVDPKVARFCANLLALEPSLWLFAVEDGVEPTNNHAERTLRTVVLWRKRSFGSHSEAGCRFVERMLTVVQTLRLQKRPVLTYLEDAIRAHRAGRPAPKLLPVQ
ncbi:MAG TPA: IS66 family transposase [Gemmataceae bacterium]|nr:IS66 family transposase [Gemmataceae bacterium]